MKAYRHADGSIWTFRPDDERRRGSPRSARRLALPELPAAAFLESLRRAGRGRPGVGAGTEHGEASLYLRPFMFATEAFLGVRPAAKVTYSRHRLPGRPLLQRRRSSRCSIWVSGEYVRAAPGGTGAAKCGGNYAASLVAQVEASEHQCDQVVFLDGLEHKWVEELGGMNLFFVHRGRQHRHARADRHHPRGHHPRLDRRAGQGARPRRHRAPHLDRRVARGCRLR